MRKARHSMPERAAAQGGSAPALAGPRRPVGRYSSIPFTFPSARRFSMIFCAMCGGTGS